MSKKLKSGFIIALIVAIIVDIIEFPITAGTLIAGIPILIIIDIITAIILWNLLGKDYRILPVAIFEAIPLLQLFPLWTLFVIAFGNKKSKK